MSSSADHHPAKALPGGAWAMVIHRGLFDGLRESTDWRAVWTEIAILAAEQAVAARDAAR